MRRKYFRFHLRGTCKMSPPHFCARSASKNWQHDCVSNGIGACAPLSVAPFSGVSSYHSIRLCKDLARLKSIEHCAMSWRICSPSFDSANDDAFCRMVASGEMPAAIWASAMSARVISCRWMGANCDVVLSITARTANGAFPGCVAFAAPPPVSPAAASSLRGITMNVSGFSLSKVALSRRYPAFLAKSPQ